MDNYPELVPTSEESSLLATVLGDRATGSSLVARIADWIGRAIVEGRLRPGDDLNSVDLSKRFQSSRTPVREALMLLEREGLVEITPRRRPRVALFTLKEVREIYQLRAALYALASELIVGHASDDGIASLWRCYETLDSAAERDDVDGYFWANVAFRDAEMDLCENTQLRRIIDSLRLRTMQLRHFSLSLPRRLERSNLDHRRLMQAYSDRDAALAAALNRSIVSEALHAIEAAWGQLERGIGHQETAP
ncbi:GntR family transcriptional regulator [bacterium]|nr:MAG: GntR family transcriptional regulator [bacterium]